MTSHCLFRWLWRPTAEPFNGSLYDSRIFTYYCQKKDSNEKENWGKLYRGRKKEVRRIIRQHVAAQLGLATTPRPHHRHHLPLPDAEGRNASSASSIPESHLHQFRYMALPQPTQEACTQRAAARKPNTKNSSVGVQKCTAWWEVLHQKHWGCCPRLQRTSFFDGLPQWYSLVVEECCGMQAEMWEYGLWCMV